MGNPPEFYYKVLSIPKHSSPEQIRSAYRSLIKKWHPDKHPPSSRPEAEARFKSITEAYEALSDQQENRAMLGLIYSDAGCGITSNRWSAKAAEAEPKEASPKKAKEVYCSTGNAGARQAFSSSILRKPPPIEKKLECTLEELCHGCKKEVKFTREVVTKTGLIVKTEETQAIKVKPGWKKGTKITFKGMGDERPGCIPADVVFSISEKKHPVFKRAGDDLVLKVEVPLVNALTGWGFSFRPLTGEKMSCSFCDEIIHPGYEKLIKGQGMPLANAKGARGNLRIKFDVVFPKKLSNEQRSGIMELLRECSWSSH